MTCDIHYEEMMSLKLDGLLDAHEERRFSAHLAECAECAPVWAALQEADAILCASAAVAIAVPADFHAKVMSQVASTVVFRPQLGYDHALTRPLPDLSLARGTIYGDGRQYGHTEALRRRVAPYARGIAGASLSFMGTVGLLLVLILSGTLSLGEPFAPTVQVLRTFFNSAGMWVRSLFIGVGTDILAISALVLGLLLFVGWQVVAGYQRSALEHTGHTAYLEAAS